MNKTIGMLAHVDAGKTTFAEQLLYHTRSIRSRGRVDHQDTFMDHHEIERARGITVFAGQAVMQYGESVYYLLDTPGHADFSAEMERALRMMDYAVVLISAVEGIEGHTETIWQLLREYRIPTFFFINKMDRIGADADRVMQEIRDLLTPDAADFTQYRHPDQYEPVDEELQNFLAERDETLLSAYLDGEVTTEQWETAMIRMIRECRLYPCMYGSALQDEGITRFLEQLDRLTVTNYDAGLPFAGQVYKIAHDTNGTRITYIKALQGILRVRDSLSYTSHLSNLVLEEKITGIRMYNGEKHQPADHVSAGELFAVTGLTEAGPLSGLGEYAGNRPFRLIPALTSRVSYPSELPIREVLRIFRELEAEDPSLGVNWEEQLQELHIQVMGAIQLEILEKLLLDRFGLQVTFEPPEILYKETITCSVIGYGHFEPLRHYAEVHLQLEPGEKGSGIVFRNACHPDQLAVGYQNLVGQHVLEREHHGLLTGAGLTDTVITLLTGRAHNKHTSGGDFREATYRAIRQGLEQADNIVLEPYYHFRIRTELEHMGRIMSDVQQAHGTIEPPEMTTTHCLLTGKVPVATFMNYSAELASFTHGKGIISLALDGYWPCHNQQEVIERKQYRKEADPLYSSSSIFCAKGQGYSVPWQEAKNHMHA
ncbi:GTP-binding protein [Paenibacillus bovis]|uniref:Elongation factor G n=1 Tax=Paenibacillus bovis TaxID=1616788 RepID=A0A172ZGX7_9BACL|nr:TetM/TetW/TetO/TetS family tetracycline resistance ribosomal protection protein [Paenibacillus bovis]ANF96662.1 elongation factor G [Paenibacillus bovis]